VHALRCIARRAIDREGTTEMHKFADLFAWLDGEHNIDSLLWEPDTVNDPGLDPTTWPQGSDTETSDGSSPPTSVDDVFRIGTDGGDGCDIFSFDLVAGGAGADTITDFARGEDLVWVVGDQASWGRLDSDDNGVLDDADSTVSVMGGNLTLDIGGLQSGMSEAATITFMGVTVLDRGDLLLADS
jgi:hypothetical protein